MKIYPRQRILDIWRAVVSSSFRNGKWIWGGSDGSNSISDAEQLLCLLYPATAIDTLALDRPDAMADDVLSTLRQFSESRNQIPYVIIDVLAQYMVKYTDDSGDPIFAGGGYLRSHSGPDEAGKIGERLKLSEKQSALDIVDAYSMSVTLCLAALGFIDVYSPTVRRPEQKAKVSELKEAANRRLTAAMVGLLRSFVVNTVDPEEPAGKQILRMVNQTDAQDPVILAKLRDRLARVRARLRDDVRIGVAPEIGLEDENMLFECGWSWGITGNAVPIDFVKGEIASRVGAADDRPYLYFTVVALDGIRDLSSARTRELGLLDEEQRRLADALQIRSSLTQRYWATIARFGEERWPLEDIPWRTSDGMESEYYSLLVSSVLVEDLVNWQATDDDLTRAVTVLESLASRGRITSRVMSDDPAVSLHVPGVHMTLTNTADLGPQLYWKVADFAPLLLKRSLQAARYSANVNAHDRLMAIAEATMDHLARRQLSGPVVAGLWDDPAALFSSRDVKSPNGKPSWYFTERVVEGLVTAAKTFEEPPLRSRQMITTALDLLNEAEHLLNQEMLEAGAEEYTKMYASLQETEAKLSRARRILNERPGTANALALEALQELDQLAVARLDAARSN
ncbi:MAG: SCO2524 family protein [Pseudonocardiaceae bacterium]